MNERHGVRAARHADTDLRRAAKRTAVKHDLRDRDGVDVDRATAAACVGLGGGRSRRCCRGTGARAGTRAGAGAGTRARTDGTGRDRAALASLAQLDAEGLQGLPVLERDVLLVVVEALLRRDELVSVAGLEVDLDGRGFPLLVGDLELLRLLADDGDVRARGHELERDLALQDLQ